MTAAPAEGGERLAAVESPATLGEAARSFFGRPSPRILAVLLAAAAVARVAVGGFGPWDVPVALAVAAWWPFQEWLFHVRLLHLPPLRIAGRRVDFEFARRHRAHHREPWRLDLVLLPVWVHLLAPVLVLLFLALLPTPALACTAMVVFVAMALQYEWIHFLVHTRYPPRGARYREICRNHRLHHFKNEHHWFGFTLTGVDRLLGTAPDPKDVPTSETCRTLGVDPP